MTSELGRALDALSERRRRRVLVSVRDGPIETDALVEQLVEPLPDLLATSADDLPDEWL
jgi:hypothetical protein